MRLSDFILANLEAILLNWDAFARTHDAYGTQTTHLTLRDHAAEMLQLISADLHAFEASTIPSTETDDGVSTASPAAHTPAALHGAQRAATGLTITELVSEYRALRASVLHLWIKDELAMTDADRDDLIWFNELIDRALAESAARYSKEVEFTKQMFIAVLGHDLRTPLGAILIGSEYMLNFAGLQSPHLLMAERVVRSARRMDHLVEALLDFTRLQVGTDIPIRPIELSLDREVLAAIDEIKGAHPDICIEFASSGDTNGPFDATRMQQVLVNVLSNAVQHGTTGQPITVSLHGAEHEVALGIHNHGNTIPDAAPSNLFDPMKRIRPGTDSSWDSRNLGLGLYVAKRIVTAHKGHISVKSANGFGTLFTITFPRAARESQLPTAPQSPLATT